jgi:uncharacterized protein
LIHDFVLTEVFMDDTICLFMSHQPVIDGFEFARAGSRLSGSWRLGDFPRLLDVLHEPQGELRYQLQGLPELQGRPALQLSVEGTLRLTCQRCLEPLDFALRAHASLLLYPSEAEIGSVLADAEGPDRIVAGREMAVRDLIEDEVLLAIPIAPRHPQCTTRAGGEAGARQTPFAGLRGMLGGGKQ